MKSIFHPSVLVLEGPNIIAGAYKGFMNATGQDVDSTYLLYVGGGTAALKGSINAVLIKSYNFLTEEERVEKCREIFREEIGDMVSPEQLELLVLKFMKEDEARFLGKDAVWEGTKTFAKSLPAAGVEMIVGYALGYVAGKVFS